MGNRAAQVWLGASPTFRGVTIRLTDCRDKKEIDNTQLGREGLRGKRCEMTTPPPAYPLKWADSSQCRPPTWRISQ
jgi:hypothetical protein